MPDIATSTGRSDISGPVTKLQVQDLMGRDREIIIVHDGDEYRLRLTSNNKLILTK